MTNTYYNFKNNVNDLPNLVTHEQIRKMELDKTKNWHISIFRYNEEHKKQYKEKGSVAGIKDTVTDVLLWDFDSTDLEVSRKDAVELCTRLIEKYNVDPNNIECYFSGSKGFHIVLPLSNEINAKQFRQAVMQIGGDLKIDPTVTHSQALIRLENTVNQKSGLYKIPLDIDELLTLSIDRIKELAKSPREDFKINVSPVSLPAYLFAVKEKEKKETKVTGVLDLTKKPRGWQDYVYSILEGNYKSGERHQALMVLAAKCRGMGYDKEQTYFLCKSSLKKQATISGQDEFEKEELWKNIIEDSVYSDRWEGGSFSPKNNPWLAKYCQEHNIKWDNLTEANITSVTEAFDSFENFAINIDKLTIKTGIPGLDEQLRLTVGMSVGLVASPGVGKTSISLQILNNMSLQGHRSIFFSYDMYAPIVYQKLVQKHMKIGSTTMFEKFKTDEQFRTKVKEKITSEYNKVSFCFKTGQSIPDIISTIKEVEETTGEKVKFVVVDYNELVQTDYSDATASSSFVAQKMREIAQSMDICVFCLFQPSKMSGSPSDEVKSYNAAKGSGAISQSVSVMLGMSRPGYNPQNPEDDRFINLSCLKNRMGPLFSLDWGWDGLTGTISKMSDEDYEDLKKIRENKTLAASGDSNGGWN